MRGSVIGRQRKDGSTVWCIKYLDGTGKQKWETIGPDKRVAERELAKRITDAHYGPLQTGDATFNDYLPTWEAAKERSVRPGGMEALRSHVRNHLQPIFGDMPLRQLTLPVVQARLVTPWTGHPGTLRKVLSTLSGITKMAAVEGLMTPIDFSSLMLPRNEPNELPTALTLDEVYHLISKIDERYAPDVLFLAMTGLRRGEWVALLQKDVNLEENTAFIHRIQDRYGNIQFPKRDKRRKVILFDKAREAYDWRLAVNASLGLEDNELSFPAPRGGMIQPQNFYARIWRPATVRAGFPNLRIHDLRHTAASLMIHAGAPAQFVANQLGHEDPAFTMREYVHWFKEQNQEIVDKVNAAFAASQ